MVTRIWVVLLMVFAAFSWAVYAYCDSGNMEGQPSPQALAGWNTWQQKNCQSCHQLYGLGGYMGPDLTNTFSQPGKGADYMRTFIKHGTGRMPDFRLNDREADELISFLSWVDRSGKSIVSPEQVHWSGTYDLDKK